MTSDIEELLADGMARYAEGIPQREGLVRAARGRLRRRRIARTGGTVSAALVVAIVAVVIATGEAQHEPPMTTNAYVIGKVEDALYSAGANNGLVMYAEVSDPVVKGTIKNWDYHGTGVNELPGAVGPLITAYSIAGDTLTWTTVNYTSRTWSRDSTRTGRGGLLPPSFPDRGQYQVFPPCPASGTRASTATLDWPAYLRSELSCGAFHYEGRTTLGGKSVIELAADNSTSISGNVSEKLWVDPQTYLPVRAVSQIKIGSAPPGFLPPGTYEPSVTTFQWLPPTPANLSLLKISVPPGFRRVK